MPLYIAGAGGFGRETLDALLARGGKATAFLDERRAGTRCRGLPVLHPEDAAEDAEFVVGVGDPTIRRRLARQLLARGLVARTVVHPRAIIGPETALGPGSVILANAHLSSSIRGGNHIQVNYNATVGHDAVLGDFVTILPGANVAGTVELQEGVTVGSNACVLQGLRIGRGAIVGAGAVVTRSVFEGELVVGVPARPRPHSQTPAPDR